MIEPQPKFPAIIAASSIAWELGVECRFAQLAQVIEKARRDGFEAVRMEVIPGGYRLAFQRKPRIADPIDAMVEHSRNHFAANQENQHI